MTFFDLARANQPAIWRVCRVLAKNKEDAEDLIGDVLLKGYRGWGDYRGEGFPTWINRVAFHAFLDVKKKRRVSQVPIDAILQDEAFDPPSKEPSPFDVVSDSIEAEDLAARIRGLPPHMQEVVSTLLGGATYEETADALGIKVGTVKSRLNRAKALLR